MRDYVIRLISVLIVILLVFGIAEWLDIKWLQKGNSNRILFILPVAFATSWIVSYILKKSRLN
ncbi:hypothetical protein [Priestia megaterium]|uniref:hypothetical protein n=1 Tax=Priestia megaterium TaxID=1404 RepID=UPI002079B8DD|nr:hypothetical protein [Priestia megaterium]USL27551.1 hypothetical protein LIT33_27750 [Priestia megaterium]USL33546.1 hypothetical protein LIT30_27740 [Priestia megaterium]WDM31502.1 hypothetical protein J8N01_00415 [Priestia megaterium]